MNQVVQDKMMRQIMVIKNNIVFANIDRTTGFLDVGSLNFEDLLLQNYEYMQRGIAETNFEYKQPIPYGVVRDTSTNKIFLYKRGGSGSNAGDARLHSKISIWVGGHIEKDDRVSDNIMVDCLRREIQEEMGISEDLIQSVSLIWGINDDSNEVGKVHFWLAYLVDVSTQDFALEDGELEKGSFMSIEEIGTMIASWEYDVETWTKILFEPLKAYLTV